MESIKSEKFEALNKTELNEIHGGDFNQWKVIYVDEDASILQRYSWWGLVGTTDTLAD